MIIRRSLGVAAALSLILASLAEAQMVVRRPPDETRQKREELRARIEKLDLSNPTDQADRPRLVEQLIKAESAAAGADRANGSALLSQAGVTLAGDGDASTVSLQAFEFFTSKNTRFYLRSTLPLAADAPPEASAETSAMPSEALRVGILDPFGGPLNATLGYYHLREYDQGRQFAIDARAGLKLLATPQLDGDDDADAGSRPNPFGTAMAVAKVALPLRRKLDEAPAGTLSLAFGGNFTVAASKSYLEALTDVDRSIFNLWVAASIELPGIFYLTVEGSPWSSNKAWGNRIGVSINVTRPAEARD